jgi:adenosylcobinamide-phosphate synthase
MARDLIAQAWIYLAPSAPLLIAAIALDLMIGDPVYPFHPVRLIGSTLTFCETLLRRAGADGYGGGIALFLVLSFFWIVLIAALIAVCALVSPPLAHAVHLFVLYSFIALGDLIGHVRRVEHALLHDDIALAREAIGWLVGRDTAPMDAAACRRAAIESLSENLTDGFISPILWYAVLGVPGLVLFKVVSTMDSMVGNKTPRYLRFGWCGARSDDVMNYIPARLSLPLIAGASAFVPGCSPVKSWRIGLSQNALLPSPNSGWSEAATAGAIQRRLVGPIWMKGALVTGIWIGVSSDPPASAHEDVTRALRLSAVSGVAFALLTCAALFYFRGA